MSNDQTVERQEERALVTYTKLMRAADSTSLRLQRGVMSRERLTESQVQALRALRVQGSLTHSELSRELGKTGGNITLVIDNLEKRALVERVRNPEDRRSVSVYLTPSGEELIDKVFPHLLEEIAEEMSALTVSEQEELRRLCRKLHRCP